MNIQIFQETPSDLFQRLSVCAEANLHPLTRKDVSRNGFLTFPSAHFHRQLRDDEAKLLHAVTRLACSNFCPDTNYPD
jgi:hypothetical protein